MTCARHANVLQQLVVQTDQQIRINVIFFERIGVLAEADSLQPIPYGAHAASSSSSASASFRSLVSNPSVNQP